MHEIRTREKNLFCYCIDRLSGLNSSDSAILGTNEVVKPILSSIGTNIAAFLPLILLPGIMGKFMRIIPIVFSLALLASLFEAFFLLPSHYADWTARSKVFKRGEKKFFVMLRRAYGHLLIKILRRRYLVLAALVLVLCLSVLLIPLIGVEMFGAEDIDQFRVLIKMPEGTSLEETDRVIQKFEAKAQKLPQSEIQDIIVNVGLLQGNNEWLTRKNVAQILFQLKPKEDRSMSTNEILQMMRKNVQYINGPISVQFEEQTSGPPVGKPISVKVQGIYFEDIKKASLALQDSIRLIAGTHDVTDDFPPGKQEIRIIVNEDNAALYGFNTQFLARNGRYAFDGITATEFRDGDDEIDVVVKYNQVNRSALDDVLHLKLTNAQGQTVALQDIVKFEIKPGRDEIKRFDQKRTIMVTGEIDQTKTSMDKVNQRLTSMFPVMEKQFPGISFEFGGAFEEFINVFQDITSFFILSMILIFLILGTQFNSYIQPLIILTTVPFALIGAMLGLIISSNLFSIVSLFGFVALAGIVVNDAIILISFINSRRQKSSASVFRSWRSIVNSGRLRLRLIILISLTTISGLFPMAFGIGGMSEMWSPLANVILFGLLVSTILTLFIIPCLVAVVDDIKRRK